MAGRQGHEAYRAEHPGDLSGLGIGFIFVPVAVVALTSVERQESGAASSLLNVRQMVGARLACRSS
ncbi:MAG TPA: hypothetical protein VII16_13575 [Actinomycetes bacterium]